MWQEKDYSCVSCFFSCVLRETKYFFVKPIPNKKVFTWQMPCRVLPDSTISGHTGKRDGSEKGFGRKPLIILMWVPLEASEIFCFLCLLVDKKIVRGKDLWLGCKGLGESGFPWKRYRKKGDGGWGSAGIYRRDLHTSNVRRSCRSHRFALVIPSK